MVKLQALHIEIVIFYSFIRYILILKPEYDKQNKFIFLLFHFLVDRRTSLHRLPRKTALPKNNKWRHLTFWKFSNITKDGFELTPMAKVIYTKPTFRSGVDGPAIRVIPLSYASGDLLASPKFKFGKIFLRKIIMIIRTRLLCVK